MKHLYYMLLLCGITLSMSGCDKKDDGAPCVLAEVMGPADCGDGTVIAVYAGAEKKVGASPTKMYVVYDMPENLQVAGTTFTCQLAAPEEDQEGRVCPAIYVMYERVSLRSVCSMVEPATKG